MTNKPNPKDSRFINFLGGYNLLYALTVAILLCVFILLLNSISFVFNPINVVIMSIATPMLLAIIFYYMFVPLVDYLYTLRVPRSIGAAISIILLIILFVVSFGLAIPIIVNQITSFAKAIPGLVNNLVNILEKYSSSAEFQVYYKQAIDWINSSLNGIAQQLLQTLTTTIQGISSIISTVSSVLIALMTFPIFLMFLLIDGRQFKNQFLQLFPSQTRLELDTLLKNINLKVGAYIKGRLFVSFLVGAYYFITLTIIGMDYTFVLAFLAGLLSLIPYLGAVIALVPLIIVALTKSTITAILTLIIWGFAQILDGNILGPSIIGRNLNIHPLMIIIVLIGSGSFLGVVGMIIGIPVYAILREIFMFFFKKYKKRYVRFFNDNNEY
ncbi:MULTISPECIES: AI-2E family transporter [unclassified Granulicatella]|uniref:AI-2E family transporter n=1 Tax=unclassified Granulicatella TaxID=2630493 RepID=UPI001073DC80|nr:MULTISPECIES: AI-2E family transporter [unclassified Granulicatella]MBF0779964.1 AI-2E family transporter [Granulicatella sp. 19428wC4_WM01]TFU95980.1 AI-2E family transporter [Granulicatella sp. WM01]